MSVRTILTVCCKVVGILFVYHGSRQLLWSFGSLSDFFRVACPTIAFFAAAFYVIQHADQVASYLAGNLAEEKMSIPDDRGFWIHLSFVLLALWFIVRATADVAGAVTTFIVYSRPGDPQGLPEATEGSLVLVFGLILLCRSAPRIAALSEPRTRDR